MRTGALCEIADIELVRTLAADEAQRVQIALERRAEGGAWLRIHARGADKSAPYATLDASDRIDLLETLYERLTGHDPEVADAPDPPAGLSFRARRAFRRDFQAAELERLVRAAMPVEPSELAALGQRRGEAIERALTRRGELALNRVLLARADKVTPEQGAVRYELTVR